MKAIAVFPNTRTVTLSGRFPIEGYRDLLLGDATGIKNVLRIAA